MLVGGVVGVAVKPSSGLAATVGRSVISVSETNRTMTDAIAPAVINVLVLILIIIITFQFDPLFANVLMVTSLAERLAGVPCGPTPQWLCSNSLPDRPTARTYRAGPDR